MLLTLLAIPVLYTWFDNIALAGRRLVRIVRRNRPMLDRGATELGLVASASAWSVDLPSVSEVFPGTAAMR